MNYTFHQLRIFREVCLTGSITRAADELNLTQPAVSIQLKNLQNQFDIPLIEVIGRRVQVTDFGWRVNESASRILEETEALQDMVSDYKGLLTGDLKISLVSTAKYVMPYFLTGFMRKHPGVNVSVDVTNRSTVIDDLATNRTDLALVSLLPKGLAVHQVELMENELLFVGNSEHIEVDEGIDYVLKKYPLIYRESGSATRMATEEYVKKQKLKVPFSMTLTSNEATKQAVLAGVGISMLPRIGIRQELKTGKLKTIPVPETPPITTWQLIWLSAKQPSPAMREFIRSIKERKQEVISNYFE
jgi:DNA-binding transcriptional LysR family regulator